MHSEETEFKSEFLFFLNRHIEVIIFYHDEQLTQATAPSHLCIQNANSLDSAYKAVISYGV